MKFNLRKSFNWFIQRAFVFYFLIVVLFLMAFDHKKIAYKSGLLVLNRVRPASFAVLWNIMEGLEQADEEKLGEQMFYFRKVVELVPADEDLSYSKADALGLLAFCHYHLGDKKKAIKYYKKAIQLSPDFFWYHYNLGLIYFQKEKYDLAINSMKESFEKEPKDILNYIYVSKVKLPISLEIDIPDEEIVNRLINGYRDGYMLVIESNLRMKYYQKALHSSKYALQYNFGNVQHFYYYAGLASYELEEYTRAVNFFKQCLNLDNDYTNAYKYLALSLKKLGKT